jgi:hypothetical protein
MQPFSVEPREGVGTVTTTGLRLFFLTVAVAAVAVLVFLIASATFAGGS